MVRVMDVAGIAEDLPIYPLTHFAGRNEAGVWLPVVGVDEVSWRVWPSIHDIKFPIIIKRNFL